MNEESWSRHVDGIVFSDSDVDLLYTETRM